MSDPLKGVKFIEWRAIQNRMPGPDPEKRVVVQGSGIAPTTGYRVELSEHEPPKFSPFELVFDLIIHEPQGSEIDVLWPITVELDTSSAFDIETVSILAEDGSTVESIKVEVID